MPESPLIEQEVGALRTLEQLAAERAQAEIETEQTFSARKESEAKTFRGASERLATASKSEVEANQARYKSVRAETVKKFEAEKQATEREYAEVQNKIAARHKSGRSSAKKAMDETRWQVLAMFEAGKDGAVKQNKERETQLKAADEHLDVVKADAEIALRACRRFALPETPSSATPEPQAPAADAAPPEVAAGESPVADSTPPAVTVPADNPIDAYPEQIKKADDYLAELLKLKLPNFLKPQNFIWPFVILAMLGAFGLGIALNNWTVGPAIAAVVAIGLGIGMWFMLAGKARRSVTRVYHPLTRALAEAEQLRDQGRAWSKAAFERKKVEIEEKRETDTKQAEKKAAQAVSDVEIWRSKETKTADEKYPALLKEIEQKRELALKDVDEKYPKRIAEVQQRFETEKQQLHESYRVQKETTQKLHEDAWNALANRWQEGLTRVGAEVGHVNEVCRQAFMNWHDTDVAQWKPPRAVPPEMRFGEFTVDLSEIPQGVPTDDRLKAMGPTSFTMPSLLGFPGQSSLMIKSAESGRAAAIALIQAVMLRFLTSVPPGKIRFTIIDPVGLGENFAAYMHLADYHELSVTSRIWTETPHIEQRLTDLSAHMENVIQKYLRNEFQSIEEYNTHAGEVAEPFRVLVVANFPVNFSEQAARRLASIVNSGARCGVYTLMNVDLKQQLPTGIQLKDLEPHCLNLNWRDGQLNWRDANFGRFPLQLDAPPDQETISRLMHTVGALARDANRVEVPFEFIAPKPEDYWKGDTRKGVDVPLGRAGATKLQHLMLGKGTSQHVLTAGKTGSGKSTLLHALIVNAALRYSPDQLELYLIDFKKGVEFKVYAAMELPHARVIAVESEREFGLSVLQRLDVELRTRGDRFRDLGVQDLRGYRDLMNGKDPLPRILFVVDEFQEFFVEDDKVAQEVSLLLDRLVRQGRAFGVHVILGSQTLGGSYSLPRATLGQMAVRIALQCSEADAHMILSEDNSAARLLTRPGEAIYNDANGLVEGNNFFQVVWLSDERRERYLEDIQKLNRDWGRPPASQIVFEGNLPAVASKNHLLGQLLQASAWPEPPKADFAWLGEAIAIKDPTAAVFRSQSGSNLLIVGQYDEGALGILSMALVSLAAQHNPADSASAARFYLFDGSPADSSNAGKLAEVAAVLPHSIQDVTWRTLPGVMKELSDEVTRRQGDESGEAPPIYLLIYDLQRFRDLRKSDDDFGGFSRHDDDKPVPASRSFGTVMRDGPPVGVHTIVWCDSLNNLNRAFDRQGLKEFEMRILFQMSQNDSSSLIDSPAAGKLGPNRGLYFSEEEGRVEKFRPYGPPTEDWLSSVRARFAARGATVVGPKPHAESANGGPAAGDGANGTQAHAERTNANPLLDDSPLPEGAELPNP